ncbi:hypothetical protein B9Z55_004856 [Caenorhabditis nigoni]|uniref:Methyltransferase FkbM domain-containing protein n=1 Tax=Caenorhabditis nigoni TaxID=1611254 RepID=A0A2G5UYB9_9PELO|nr:hypothetical protein B9Z55_004856 [Caenorhabditis nigoni]
MDRNVCSGACASFRRSSFIFYILFAVFLYIILMTRPQQMMVVEVPEAAKTGKMEKPVEKPKRKEWDTLDGIGYKFAEKKNIVLDPRFEKLNKLPKCDLSVDKSPSKIDTPQVMEAFQKCIRPIVEKWKGDLKSINTKWTKTSPCDSVFKGIDIVPMANLHETKWTILPTCKEENIMVTLGIGHDTMAEEKLNITLPNTKFFGADPIIEPNRQLYTAFGKYFPFAIGKKPGFTKFRVLPNQNQKTRKYEFQDVTTIPFTYFLSDILGLKQIDIAWIDIEGGEFEFLDQLHRGGPMDEKGIVICQFNLEVHSKFHPPGAQVFHDFVFKVLDDKRYVFLKPAATDVGVHRMFFINLENEQCVRKFLQ